MNDYTLFQTDIECWELGESLSMLFDSIKPIKAKLKKLIDLNIIKTYIDICIVHYDSFPAMIIEEDNMSFIRELKADISIDMY